MQYSSVDIMEEVEYRIIAKGTDGISVWPSIWESFETAKARYNYFKEKNRTVLMQKRVVVCHDVTDMEGEEQWQREF